MSTRPGPNGTDVSVPVQLVFASPTDEGLVLDCTLAADVHEPGHLPIPAGAPFSIVVDHRAHDPEYSIAALELLGRWSATGVVVHATASATSSRLVLRHHNDELVLELA